MLLAGYQRAAAQLHRHHAWLRRFQASTLPASFVRGPLLSHERRSPSNRAGYATKPVRIRKHALKRALLEEHPSRKAQAANLYTERLRDDLRQAIADHRFDDVVRIYHQLKDKSVFNRHDFRFIAQCLHSRFRDHSRTFATMPLKERQERTAEFAVFAEKLVHDLKDGILSANSAASVHLLGFFNEAGLKDAGLEFWGWLEKQDDYAVTVDVYGAAIELLAVTGSPLAETEELYQRALVRFPGNFAAYHLSPGAIVPDRDLAVRLPGIPMSLLQGIMTARLLHGDFRNAYLALDTALRLYPDQTPNRFFVVYLEERPLLEAYTIFAIACRAGIVLPSNQFRKLLARLHSSSDQSSLGLHALVVRAQISALYMYIGAGGRFTDNMANELIIAVTRFVRLPDIVSLNATQKQPIVARLMEIIRSTLTIFARYGVHPKSAAFNSIVGNIGGWGLAQQAIGVALADAQALGIEPTGTTRRSVLIAYGLNGNEEMVASSWSDLVKSKQTLAKHPDTTDWHCLIKAAHSASCVEFAEREFTSRKEYVPEPDHAGILAGLDNPKNYGVCVWDGEAVDDSIFTQLDKIQADLRLFNEKTMEAPRVQDFGDCAPGLPMTILRPQNDLVPERIVTELYDEYTIERQSRNDADEDLQEDDQSPSRPEQEGLQTRRSGESGVQDSMSAPTRTQTGISFGTLRYENWKCLNWLLEQAESSEQAYLQLVDRAIANGTSVPRRPVTLHINKVDDLESYGLSDAAQLATQTLKQEAPSEEEAAAAAATWRERILKLRAR